MFLFLASAAFADIASDVECEAEGDACTLDGVDGTCDADLACVVGEEDSKGCSTAGPVGAGAMVVFAMGLLTLRPRR